jgi:hypothetical protein
MDKDQKRTILIGAIGLIKGTVRNDGQAMLTVCDELEPHLKQSHFFKDATS